MCVHDAAIKTKFFIYFGPISIGHDSKLLKQILICTVMLLL